MTTSLPHSSPTRSWRLIILTGALAMFQAVAAVRALHVPAALAAQINLPLPLEFVAGGLWSLLFTFITVNLIQTRPLAARRAGWAIIGFIIYSAVRLLLFAQADYDRERYPFLLLLTVLISAIVAAALLRRPSQGEL